jgi:hypothetical protein
LYNIEKKIIIKEDKILEEQKYRWGKKKILFIIFIYFPIFCGFGGSKNKFITMAGTESYQKIKNNKLYINIIRNIFRN